MTMGVICGVHYTNNKSQLNKCKETLKPSMDISSSHIFHLIEKLDDI